jgi:hypothetical protein
MPPPEAALPDAVPTTLRARLAAVNGRVKMLVQEYGPFAVAMLFILGVLNIAVFYAAIRLGFSDAGLGTGSTLLAAYVASRTTKPFAGMAALVLTPVVARIWRRRGR